MRLPLPHAILELLTPHKLFARLDIASKMLLGYMTLVVFTVVVVAYALLSLQRMNSLNSEIVTVDMPTQETADKMREALLAQDAYEKRYLILRDNDMRNLFRKRSEEFKSLIEVLRNLHSSTQLPLEQVSILHTRYGNLFAREMKLIRAGDTAGAMAISNGGLKKKLDKLLETLRTISVEAKTSQDGKMKKIHEIGSTAFFTTAALCILSIMLGAVSGMVVTNHISSSINKLREATARIAEGNFQYDPKITTNDEIGDLALAFVAMGKRLEKIEEMYLDASPLTRLPGGIAIENVLKRRIESGRPLAFCVLDLDNFKSFNDHYGYAHGNVVLKETAKIIETATRSKGSQDDFVGHVGGDDFVVITSPVAMRDIL